MPPSPPWIVRRAAEFGARASRRPGLRELRLLPAELCDHQNVILVEATAGAEVEEHRVATSESLYVLAGRFEATGGRQPVPLGPGDLVYFPPGASHGLRCVEGPGRFLAIFAPATGLPAERPGRA